MITYVSRNLDDGYIQGMCDILAPLLVVFEDELSYDSIFRVWETIWAATRTFSPHFPLFFALAMVTNYRDVIIANNMDFTDMIKFFNEMAERHDCARLLAAARTHVKCLQNLVQQLR
ncbi:hypothetical protein NECAME_03492 [Necator americanus]|uniref:Uncharacterized protein n=1 Tax=Necator americanus TaxID=51031 RepID=W2T454_NECAM|nr:hypothetical protein NECAME_03492 [Necator americanus]ETN76329.1 hypothetical protein NECAME_03492 [Necator americanus]